MSVDIKAAERKFCDEVKLRFGFTEAEARKIMDVYRTFEIIKLDYQVGVYCYIDYMFIDKDAMQEALNKNK